MRRWLGSILVALMLAVAPLQASAQNATGPGTLMGYTLQQWKDYITADLNSWDVNRIIEGLELYMWFYLPCETGEIGPTEQCWN